MLSINSLQSTCEFMFVAEMKVVERNGTYHLAEQGIVDLTLFKSLEPKQPQIGHQHTPLYLHIYIVEMVRG